MVNIYNIQNTLKCNNILKINSLNIITIYNTLEIMKEYSLTLSHISNIGLDVHLMVENVEQVMDDFIPLEPRVISFHYEAIKEKDRMY